MVGVLLCDVVLILDWMGSRSAFWEDFSSSVCLWYGIGWNTLGAMDGRRFLWTRREQCIAGA